ncbi:MAG: hypothetical protein GXO87_10755 [Chlorobi bacterium]|nr:hypothetical protein [Chlorobiota bacterium]
MREGKGRFYEGEFERGFGRGMGFGGGFGRGQHVDDYRHGNGNGYRLGRGRGRGFGIGRGGGFHESFDFFDYEFENVNNVEELKYIKERLRGMKSEIKQKIKSVSARIEQLESK